MTFTQPRPNKVDVKERERLWKEMTKTIYEILNLDPKNVKKKITPKK